MRIESPTQPLRVVVLMGGPSAEHDVSLASARQVIRALDPARYDVQPLLITRERAWMELPVAQFLLHARPPGVQHLVLDTCSGDGSGAVRTGTDVAFIAVHGEFGEDGTIQSILEAAGIPYTGSGVLASALAFDKPRASMVLRDAELRVPEFSVLEANASPEQRVVAAGAAVAACGLPLVVKPANRGSSVGVTIARTTEAIDPAIVHAFGFSNTVMLQRFVAGTEITCGIMEMDGRETALPPTEIVPRTGAFFDYTAKYTPGASEEITPARLPPETIQRVQDAALRAHRSLGCAGFSRTDMILAPDGTLFVLELNTIPGMTETSLLPQAAAAAGITFPQLLDHIITAALRHSWSANSRMDTNVASIAGIS